MTAYEVTKAWRKKNPEKLKEQNRRYAKKHPETHEKAKAKYRANNKERIRELDKINQRNSRKRDPEGQKRRHDRWQANKEAKLTRLAGRPRPHRCEVCGQQAHRIVFDHCHDCGQFRGWLCDRCNRLLGVVKDDPLLLRRLARYLENHNGSTKVAKNDRQASEGVTQIAIWPTGSEKIPDGH